MTDLIRPHGGTLTELIAPPERVAEIQAQSRDWPSWDLTPRQACDLELLMSGGFAPLRGFLGRRDYESVCASMRLGSGDLWPIPVVLDLPEKAAKDLGPGATLAPSGVLRAPLPAGRAALEALGEVLQALEGVLEGSRRTAV